MPSLLERLETAVPDRYRIEDQIGRGGMATVFRAQDLKHERTVAVKVLHPELSAALGPDRFLQEVKVTARLQHPHILPIFDSGRVGDLVFYVMPFIQGDSLRSRLDRARQLPVDEALRIASRVLDALDYAHRHGVIHRDIKPENILLQDDTALLADFGIALASDRAAGDRLTETGMALGTPAYMSPEQSTADRDLDGRSDIYSLGCVLFEMLTGEPPFMGGTIQSVIAKTLTEQPRRLRLIRPSVPPHVDAAVHRALQRFPADRFATAADFGLALTTPDVRAESQETAPEHAVWPDRNRPVERTFQLGLEVCRKLNRVNLDARLLGDRLNYLDNEAGSDVLILYLHGLGLDHSSFEHILRVLPYRGLAPTMYGFETAASRRITLSLADHVILLREFIRDAITRLEPRITLLVGFSHGADLGFDVLTVPPGEPPLGVDGFLSLGCNIDLSTAFVSSVMAKMSADATADVVGDLRAMGSDLTSLRDWLCLHDYLVRVFRKFQGDLAPLRSLAREIIAPFQAGDPVFARWYRNATTAVRCLRCVFSDSDPDYQAVQRIKLSHLDKGVLGPDYREETMSVEVALNHFDLMDLALHRQHVEEMLSALRGDRSADFGVRSSGVGTRNPSP